MVSVPIIPPNPSRTRSRIDDLEGTSELNEPVSNLTDANFGRIIAAGGQRRLQLGLRVQF